MQDNEERLNAVIENVDDAQRDFESMMKSYHDTDEYVTVKDRIDKASRAVHHLDGMFDQNEYPGVFMNRLESLFACLFAQSQKLCRDIYEVDASKLPASISDISTEWIVHEVDKIQRTLDEYDMGFDF